MKFSPVLLAAMLTVLPWSLPGQNEGVEAEQARLLRKLEVMQRLNALRLASVDFRDSTLAECVEWLRERGVPIELSADLAKKAEKIRVTISGKEMKAAEVVKLLLKATKTQRINVDDGKMVIYAASPGLFIEDWKVGPDFFVHEGKRLPVKEFLQKRGVTLEGGALAMYSEEKQYLRVKHTAEKIEAVENLVAEYWGK
jgi:hypothetical protein